MHRISLLVARAATMRSEVVRVGDRNPGSHRGSPSRVPVTYIRQPSRHPARQGQQADHRGHLRIGRESRRFPQPLAAGDTQALPRAQRTVIGRDWLKDEVDLFCETNDCGYFVIEAVAGMARRPSPVAGRAARGPANPCRASAIAAAPGRTNHLLLVGRFEESRYLRLVGSGPCRRPRTVTG